MSDKVRERADVFDDCVSGNISDMHRYHELWKYKGLAALRDEIAVRCNAVTSFTTSNTDHDGSCVQAMQLDVLVFAEIGMDPVNYLLAFSRLAPVQVVTHGYASYDARA